LAFTDPTAYPFSLSLGQQRKECDISGARRHLGSDGTKPPHCVWRDLDHGGLKFVQRRRGQHPAMHGLESTANNLHHTCD
jgi:hypothetical protein